MSDKTTTKLKDFFKRPYILPFLSGFIICFVLLSLVGVTYKLTNSYRQKRLRVAFDTNYSDREIRNNEQIMYTNPAPRLNIEPSRTEQDLKNQEKWDNAKKTGDFKTLLNLQTGSGFGDKPVAGDCIDTIDFKHNPTIEIPKVSIKDEQAKTIFGQVSLNYMIGMKENRGSASRGDDIIGFSMEFRCQKYDPKTPFINSFGLDGFIKVDCNEIMFLSPKFKQTLNADSCVRMRDNGSFWLFRDINGIEYDWNFIGAKEIKDTLQLEIDVK
jgi:hypothetical protein